MQSAHEMRTKIAGKAGEGADFRAKLLRGPKAAVEQESGVTMPASMSIGVHEESTAAAHPVPPPDSRLREGDRKAVVGGGRDGVGQEEGQSTERSW